MKWLLLTLVLLLGWSGDRCHAKTLKSDVEVTASVNRTPSNDDNISINNITSNEYMSPTNTTLSNQDEGPNSPELWAVLVAGSNGWYNYRHQADVCHAYQILHANGVPDENIIVMMFDDIANNSMNPTPGVVINRPNGPNVYEDILIDYRGDDVTPENFLNILKGNASAMAGIGSGKVVESKRNDRIFVNLVDHGAPGIFAFPDDYLNARDLATTVLDLQRDNKFNEMVIYVEACESGSMFKHLLPDQAGVYAVTASNPHEPSYACYMDEDLGTYLGDVFSVKWMEDSDTGISHETLHQQFHLVHKEVTTSHVMHWGERSIGRDQLWEFMGEKNDSVDVNTDWKRNSIYYNEGDKANSSDTDGAIQEVIQDEEDACTNSSVASPDVPIAIMQMKLKNAKDKNEATLCKTQLDTIYMTRMLVKAVMQSLVMQVTQDKKMAHKMKGKARDITDWDCYEKSVDAFHTTCFDLAKNPYALRVLHMVVNLCENGYTSESFVAATKIMCTHPPFTGIQ